MRKMTESECKVMQLMIEDGGTSKEIGRKLGVSYKTVDVHAEKAIRKLGAKNRMHAALIWDRITRERERINQALAQKISQLVGCNEQA